MKNKKIISITVCLVAAVLVGILGLSKFFETTWQNEDTVDNSLDVKIIDNSVSVFDYPYLDIDTAAADGCIAAISFKESADMPAVTPAEDMLTYQQAVNKVGEDIKYLTGFTGHTVTPVFAHYFYDDWFWGDHYVVNSYKAPEKAGSDKILSFSVITDAHTGEYKYIAISYDFAERFREQEKNVSYTVPEQNDELKQYVNDVFSVLNSGYTVDRIGGTVYECENENIKQYLISMVLNNSIYSHMRLYEFDDSGVYYLAYFDTDDNVVINYEK